MDAQTKKTLHAAGKIALKALEDLVDSGSIVPGLPYRVLYRGPVYVRYFRFRCV